MLEACQKYETSGVAVQSRCLVGGVANSVCTHRSAAGGIFF